MIKDAPSQIPTIRIWDKAEHNAFTDLIRFEGKWFCCFRESDTHALKRDGVLRILESMDGIRWESAAEIALPGFDLRDPHFSITSDGRLMLSTAGRVVRNGEFVSLQSFSSFSTDGQQWTPLVASGPKEHWIWRVTWVDGYAYSWVREQNLPGVKGAQPFRLLRSADGIEWEIIAEANYGNEAVTLPLRNGRMLVLLRNVNSLIGESEPPYTDWKWYRTGYFFGGPNLIELSNGRVIAGGRLFREPSLEGKHKYKDPVMLLYDVDLETRAPRPVLELASTGDCAYPGFVEYENELWVSYYSGHEGHCSIYLMRIPLDALEGDLLQQHLPFLEQGRLTDFASLNAENWRLHPLRVQNGATGKTDNA